MTQVNMFAQVPLQVLEPTDMGFLLAAAMAVLMLLATWETGLSQQVEVSNQIGEGVDLHLRYTRRVSHEVADEEYVLRHPKRFKRIAKRTLRYGNTVRFELPQQPLPSWCNGWWNAADNFQIFRVYKHKRDAGWCRDKCWLEVREDGVYGRNETTNWHPVYVYPGKNHNGFLDPDN